MFFQKEIYKYESKGNLVSCLLKAVIINTAGSLRTKTSLRKSTCREIEKCRLRRDFLGIVRLTVNSFLVFLLILRKIKELLFGLKKALIRNVIMIPNKNNYKYQQKSFFKKGHFDFVFQIFYVLF